MPTLRSLRQSLPVLCPEACLQGKRIRRRHPSPAHRRGILPLLQRFSLCKCLPLWRTFSAQPQFSQKNCAGRNPGSRLPAQRRRRLPDLSRKMQRTGHRCNLPRNWPATTYRPGKMHGLRSMRGILPGLPRQRDQVDQEISSLCCRPSST